MQRLPSFTSFHGHQRLASGSLAVNALAVRQALPKAVAPVLVFDDRTGRSIDLDLRGSDVEVQARMDAQAQAMLQSEAADGGSGMDSDAAEAGPRGRGRPKLGVVAREVTLLPRHWDWLASQPGGASVALRKLVEAARKSGQAAEQQRLARERAYQLMLALAGDLPGFEEATRALFAGDGQRLHALLTDWPADVGRYVLALASSSHDDAPDQGQEASA